MMQRGRGWRRYQTERMKNKARKIWMNSYTFYGEHNNPEKLKMLEELVNKSYNNLTLCSASCCGNPRKHFGVKTYQECKQLDGIKDFKGMNGEDFGYQHNFNHQKYI